MYFYKSIHNNCKQFVNILTNFLYIYFNDLINLEHICLDFELLLNFIVFNLRFIYAEEYTIIKRSKKHLNQSDVIIHKEYDVNDIDAL